ncbi:hypothetical protein [Acinetobacter baumannii]
MNRSWSLFWSYQQARTGVDGISTVRVRTSDAMIGWLGGGEGDS